MRGRGREARVRGALVEIETQRDDAVTYLSTTRAILDVIARGHDVPRCAQEIASLLVRQLALEACAILLHGDGAPVVMGFAQVGGGVDPRDADACLVPARLLDPVARPTCLRRSADGGYTVVPVGEADGESLCVVPLIAGERIGALVLRSLVAPAQVFARERALVLVAEVVAQALTTARVRDSLERLCDDLAGELGIARPMGDPGAVGLEARAVSIADLTQAMIQSGRARRNFLGTASHELRTPLSAILGYSSLVREGAVGDVNDEQAKLLDRVVDNTRNLSLLIDDILFFVQLDAGRVAVQPELVAVTDLLDEVLAAIPRARSAEVTTHVEVAPEATRLQVDRGLLRRLVFHLLGNAFKFTTEGEVTVRVASGEAEGAVLVEVRDTGIGMPQERVQELFEPFTQGDGRLARPYEGLGIGLALVERCVRLLGGWITVESELRKGSTFRVLLPGALATAGAARSERPRTIH